MIQKIVRHKNRYIITDDQADYQLHPDIFMRECLTVGDTADLPKLESESMVLFAVDRGMQYALRGMKSTQQVSRYLLGKNFSEETVAQAITRLQAYQLLDDQEYAKAYIQAQNGQKGSRYLRQKLYEKGVYIDEFPEEDPKNVLEIIIKRYGLPHKTDTKERLKIQNFLLNRGFSYETIKKAIKSYENVEY